MPYSQTSFPASASPAMTSGWLAPIERVLRRLPIPPLVWRIARFLCVGLVGLSVDSGLFWGLYQSGVDVKLARALSLCVATLVTWALNRFFTFAPSGRAPLQELLRYCAVALGAQGFNYGLFLGLLWVAPEAHPLICLAISAVATAALSFTGQSLVAFRRVRVG